MNRKYKIVSDALRETLNVSVSLPAYESLPSNEEKPKKKDKKKNPTTFKSQFPK